MKFPWIGPVPSDVNIGRDTTSIAPSGNHSTPDYLAIYIRVLQQRIGFERFSHEVIRYRHFIFGFEIERYLIELVGRPH